MLIFCYSLSKVRAATQNNDMHSLGATNTIMHNCKVNGLIESNHALYECEVCNYIFPNDGVCIFGDLVTITVICQNCVVENPNFTNNNHSEKNSHSDYDDAKRQVVHRNNLATSDLHSSCQSLTNLNDSIQNISSRVDADSIPVLTVEDKDAVNYSAEIHENTACQSDCVKSNQIQCKDQSCNNSAVTPGHSQSVDSQDPYSPPWIQENSRANSDNGSKSNNGKHAMLITEQRKYAKKQRIFIDKNQHLKTPEKSSPKKINENSIKDVSNPGIIYPPHPLLNQARLRNLNDLEKYIGICAENLLIEIDKTVYKNEHDTIRQFIFKKTDPAGIKVKTIFETRHNDQAATFLTPLVRKYPILTGALNNSVRWNTKSENKFQQTKIPAFLASTVSLQSKKRIITTQGCSEGIKLKQGNPLQIVNDLHEFYCIGKADNSKASILKLEVLRFMPKFYELPLFLDLIKVASFDGPIGWLSKKLSVLHSFYNHTCKNIDFDESGKIVVRLHIDNEELQKILRYHILLYLKFEGLKKNSLRFYSHAMTMKQSEDLTNKENKSLDVFLYFAFVLRNVKIDHWNQIEILQFVSSGLVIILKENESPNQKLISIDNIYDKNNFFALILDRISYYVEACLYSCDINVEESYKTHYIIIKMKIILCKANKNHDGMHEYKVCTVEEVLIDCIESYRFLVTQFHAISNK